MATTVSKRRAPVERGPATRVESREVNTTSIHMAQNSMRSWKAFFGGAFVCAAATSVMGAETAKLASAVAPYIHSVSPQINAGLALQTTAAVFAGTMLASWTHWHNTHAHD